MARDRDDDRRDEDEDRPRRSPRRDNDDDRPQRRSSRDSEGSSSSAKKLNVCGLIGLILGIPSLIVTFFPCCGWFALPGVIASLVLGIVGMVLAKGSHGRMGGGLAIASLVLGAIGLLISIVWLVFFSVAAVTAPTIPGGSTGTPVSSTDPVAASVTALELSKEYKDNEDAANTKYRGKVVEVTGKVKNASDTKVELEGFNFADVDCNFDSSQRASVSNLKVGSTVTIRGRCAGEVIFDVELNDCIVMPGGPNKPVDGVNKGAGDGALKVTAGVLAKAFTDNLVGANAKYGDKQVEVTGVVHSVDVDDPDSPTVFFGQQTKDIECRFGKGSLKPQSGVIPGKTVTIRGKCVGNDDGPVVLEDCTLVK